MTAAEAIGVGSEEWALAHAALLNLCLRRAELDAEEGKWLLRAFRAATHVHFAYASFGEYVERLFGLSRRATEEKLRVAKALEELPELEHALRSGQLTWSAVRELTRVAVAETEREWIAVAHHKTAREVERLVSGLAPGDRPGARPNSELVRHVLRFEVGAEALATFREAMRVVRKRSDHRLDDDAALLSMAREILGGPRDPGRASYQVVVTQCEDCGRGFQHANGELIALDPAILEMCRCDAQNLTIPPVPGRCQTPSTHAHMDAVVAVPSSDVHRDAAVAVSVSDAHVDAAVAVPSSDTHVDAAVLVSARDANEVARERVKGARATQDTPPAIRREVFLRDRGRCIVPGCRSATYVDLHHLDLRSEGGSDDPDNLVVLCGAHHGAVHRGRLRIDGTVSTGLRVRHADGTTYGFMPSPTLAEASAKAFAALRNLSYPEKTARVALERALASAPASASAETLLRSALIHAARC